MDSNITAKIYDYSGDILHEEVVDFKRFLFMKFLNKAKKENGIDLEEVDIQQTIRQLNKNDGLMIKSVMVIDDEPILRDAYLDTLTRHCHYVEAYEKSDDAYYAFKDDPEKYDVILTDNVMPESTLSGSEFAKAVRDISQDVKVHIITGEISSVANDIFDYDVENTISKPLNEYTFAMTLGKGKVLKKTA